jgi:protein O-GlcNAc transferase
MNKILLKKFDSAKYFMEQGNYQLADEIALFIIKNFKDGFIAWKLRSAIALKKNLPAASLEYFEKYLYQTNRNLKDLIEYSKLCFKIGELDKAEIAIKDVLELEADHYDANFLLGRILSEKKSYKSAIKYYKKALNKGGNDGQISLNIGACHFNLNEFNDAEVYFVKSNEIKANDAALVNIGLLLEEQGKIEDALEKYKMALVANPRNYRALLRYHLAMPVIYQNKNHINYYRKRYLDGLNTISSQRILIENPMLQALPGSFILSYHNENNLVHKRKTYEIYKKLININWVYEPSIVKSEKIRIGFLSTFFKNHTIGKLNQGLIKKIDRNKFEVFLIHGSASENDAFTDFMNKNADHVLCLSGDIKSQLMQLIALQLNVLVYTDIGMEMQNYFLAMYRCANVQIVFWGHPDTTGINEIDYYLLSSGIKEHLPSNEYYSEKLIILSRLPSYYEPMSLPVGEVTREELGLPRHSKLYGCPQTLFKIHPDFDEVLLKICERDKNAMIVFIEPKKKFWMEDLKKRWKLKSDLLEKKIIFLKPLPLNNFMKFVAIVDVLLDPIYFGSGNTMYEAFSYGTPIVTLPGEFMRGRIVAAAYKQMKIEDPPVCFDVDEYVEKAIKIANNSEYRENLKNSIMKSAGKELFSDEKFVREFELGVSTAFKKACDKINLIKN